MNTGDKDNETRQNFTSYQQMQSFFKSKSTVFQHGRYSFHVNRTAIEEFSFSTLSTNMSTFEEIMNTLYVVLTGIFSVISMVGTTVIIFTYIYYPELRSKGRHFLVFISAVDFLTAFGVLLGVIWTSDPYSFTEAFCQASPIITAFSSVSSYFWNVCMALYLYFTLVKGYHHLVRKLTIFSHIICWSIPGKLYLFLYVFVGIEPELAQSGSDSISRV